MTPTAIDPKSFTVSELDNSTILLTVLQPAPWLWNSKDDILGALHDGRTNLIIDLSNLDEIDVSAITLGDYLKKTLLGTIHHVALVGRVDLLEPLTEFVEQLGKIQSRAFTNVLKAKEWLSQNS